MVPIIFGSSVRGARHRSGGTSCQDAFCICLPPRSAPKPDAKHVYNAELPAGFEIAAAADGHGSESSPFSRMGARFAAEIFCDVMAEYCRKYSGDVAGLEKLLKKEPDVIRIAQTVENEWKERVRRDYADYRQGKFLSPQETEDESAVCRLYGTTLLGMVVCPSFVFAFQIGDGDITLVEEDSVVPFLERESILGVETHSLAKKAAWTHVVSKFCPMAELQSRPLLFILSTDGMLNSFVSDDEFRKSCADYLRVIARHGIEKIKSRLPQWLSETSRQGCGDDVTAVFIYYPKEPKPFETARRNREDS